MFTAAVARHLATLGFGVFDAAGATLFLEELPDTPVDAVAVNNKPAPSSGFGDDQLVGFEVTVRSSGANGRARTGFTIASDIRDAFHGLRHVTLAPGTVDEVRLMWCRGDPWTPYNLGDDANNRPRWGVRFLATIGHTTPLTLL